MAEFNTVHIVSLENASRFFSGAPVEICHIPVNFFMTIAKIFHNPSKVSYVDLSSNHYVKLGIYRSPKLLQEMEGSPLIDHCPPDCRSTCVEAI